jgi:hypothetical protein
MKPYERRAQGAYPYFFLATWNTQWLCWQDGKQAYPSEDLAKQAAKSPGKYRISQINEDGGRQDFEPFEIVQSKKLCEYTL